MIDDANYRFKLFLNELRSQPQKILPGTDPEKIGRNQRKNPKHQTPGSSAVRTQLEWYTIDHVVSRLKEELHALQENYSYVGEVVKVMGKNRVLVKVFLGLYS